VFVTLCTQIRQHFFGEIEDGQMILSLAGHVAVECWQSIPNRFPIVDTDAFVVMPDHLHGILFTEVTNDEAPLTTAGGIIRWFRASVHAAFVRGVRDSQLPPYDGRVWQRNFDDEIIRSEEHLTRLQRYIEVDPGRWWERSET